MIRQMVLLTEGVSSHGTAKTAINLIRYKPDEVLAILDSQHAGRSSQSLFGLGGAIPVIRSLEEAPGANTLVIGIAPPGGKLPPPMRARVLEALERGLNVLSGLHEFLSEDPELAAAAEKNGVCIQDIRKNHERDVAHRLNVDERCLRVHTVGNDCNVGKMVVSLELTLALKRAGHDAKFVATGQTGILIEGDGCPVDAVVVDFVNGAAEKLVLKNQHHSILLIEGQGSLAHPRYSAVTLGLLHGCMPDGLILCYEMGREKIFGMDFTIPPLARIKELYERLANVMHPSQVIGIAMNSRKFSEEAAAQEKEKISRELQLPVCDVLRHGPGELVEAILKLQEHKTNAK